MVARIGSPMVPFVSRMAGSDGLVVAHVLVHGQYDAGFLAGFDRLGCLGVLAEWFLREDAPDDAATQAALMTSSWLSGGTATSSTSMDSSSSN